MRTTNTNTLLHALPPSFTFLSSLQCGWADARRSTPFAPVFLAAGQRLHRLWSAALPPHLVLTFTVLAGAGGGFPLPPARHWRPALPLRVPRGRAPPRCGPPGAGGLAPLHGPVLQVQSAPHGGPRHRAVPPPRRHPALLHSLLLHGAACCFLNAMCRLRFAHFGVLCSLRRRPKTSELFSRWQVACLLPRPAPAY